MNLIEINNQKGFLFHASYVFLENIFLIFVICGFIDMIGIKSYVHGTLLIATFIALYYFNNLKIKAIDIIVCIYVFYCMLTYLIGNVSFELYLDGIKTQLLPISFYFIARIPLFQKIELLKRMNWPLMFAFVCALLLYFIMPPWYYAYKTSSWSIIYEGNMYYERMRLSGFWPWPYFLGTASLFFLMYELYYQNFKKKSTILFYLAVFIGASVLFLCQIRAAIAYFVVFYFAYLVMCGKTKNVFIFSIVVCMLGLIIYHYADISFLDYAKGRSIESENNFLIDRFLLFEKFIPTISFGGSGLGGLSHYAFSLKRVGVTDCDYIRIPNEIGVFGFLLLLAIIIPIIFMGIKNWKYVFFELNIIGFLFVSMIGAAPLELITLHPYIYWYCMGRIVTRKYNSNKFSIYDKFSTQKILS